MRSFFLLACALFACAVGLVAGEVKEEKKTRKHHKHHHHDKDGKHHHHHHGKHHHHHHKGEHDADTKNVKDVAVAKFNPPPPEKMHARVTTATKEAGVVGVVSHLVTKAAEPKTAVVAKAKEVNSEDSIVKKMKVLEEKLEKKKVEKQGQILVNGPLPADFKERFIQAVAAATGSDSSKVKVTKTKGGEGGVVAVSFIAPPKVVDAVEAGAADADSKLATGNLHSFLVSKDDDEEAKEEAKEEPKEERAQKGEGEVEATPVEQKGIDIDTAMPYGDLEPFGREDTAQELTEDSIKESDGMVDQLERAEVAEEKRAVFRALTRLRGAAITSFDGVARSQTGNIDEYNKIHQWRTTHPLHHLADEESDISKWAFPDNADF